MRPYTVDRLDLVRVRLIVAGTDWLRRLPEHRLSGLAERRAIAAVAVDAALDDTKREGKP